MRVKIARKDSKSKKPAHNNEYVQPYTLILYSSN